MALTSCRGGDQLSRAHGTRPAPASTRTSSTVLVTSNSLPAQYKSAVLYILYTRMGQTVGPYGKPPACWEGDSLWTGMGVPRHSLLAPAPSPDTVGWWGVLVASVADAALLVDAAAGRGGVLTTQTTLHREVLDFPAPGGARLSSTAVHTGGPLAACGPVFFSLVGRSDGNGRADRRRGPKRQDDLVPGRHSTPLDVAARLPAAVAACDVFPLSEAFFNAAHCDGLRLVRCSGGGVDHRREPDQFRILLRTPGNVQDEKKERD